MLDRLPELGSEPWRGFVINRKVLGQLVIGEQKMVVAYVISKLSENFAAHQLFGRGFELESNLEVWRNGLCDRYVSAIFDGLYYILIGMTKYIDFPPKNPIAFWDVCKEAPSFHKKLRYSFLMIEHVDDSQENKVVNEENVEKIRAMLREALKPSNLSEEEREEKRKRDLEIYRAIREEPCFWCDIHERWYYKGCYSCNKLRSIK